MRYICCMLLAGWGLAVAQTLPAEPVAAGPAFAVVGTTPVSVATYGLPVANWTGGAMVHVFDPRSSAPLFRGFDRAGREVLHCNFTMPKTSLISVRSFEYARGPDGSLAVSGSAYSDDGQPFTFVAWVSPACETRAVVRLTPFLPEAAVIAADGTIWLAGTERGRSRDEGFNPGSPALRRFDKDGKLLKALFPASALDPNPAWSRPHPAFGSRLVASRDRIGWFLPRLRKYIEFSLGGEILGQYGLPEEAAAPDRTPWPALCDDGGAYLGHISYRKTGGGGPIGWEIFSLNRSTGSWAVSPQTGRPSLVHGCDGDSLAVRTDTYTLSWLRPANRPAAAR